jgi:hypothetical protein
MYLNVQKVDKIFVMLVILNLFPESQLRNLDEDFLSTPLFGRNDGNSGNCSKAFKFSVWKAPPEASVDRINLEDAPDLTREHFYFKSGVSTYVRTYVHKCMECKIRKLSRGVYLNESNF